MYCPSCGERVTPGLSYCKHCGAELTGSGRNRWRGAGLPPALLVAAMVATFVFGIGVMAGLITVMKACGLNEGVINGFAVMSFLLMLTLEAIFTRLLLRSALGRREADGRGKTGRSTNELDAAPVRAFPEPVMSVSDHTTRTLEPVPNEKERG